MIPKIIHYCWFGRGEKPEDVASVFGIMRNNVDQIMARTREKLKKLALQYADICNG